MKTLRSIRILHVAALATATSLLVSLSTAAQPSAAAEDVRYVFLLVDRNTPGYRGDVTVNGKQVMVFEDAEEGAGSLAAGLKEGTNEAVVALERLAKAEIKEDGGCGIDLYLSPTRGGEQGTVGLDFVETSAAIARLECHFEMADGRPGRMKRTEQHWADPERKRLVYELTAEGGVEAESYDTAHEREWDEDGVPIFDAHLAGPRVQDATYYMPNGAVGAKIAGGNGTYREWYKDGVLAEDTPYRNGRVEGESKTWHDSGGLASVSTYVAGKLHGPYKEYHENGKLAEETTFVSGKAEGKSKVYFESGKLLAARTFAGDELNGPYTEYYENGKVRLKGPYRNGARHGVWTIHGANGFLLFKSLYRDDKRILGQARTIEERQRGFTLTIPGGFEEYPGGRLAENVTHAFVSYDPETDEASTFIMLVRLKGPVGPETPPLEAVRKGMFRGIARSEGLLEEVLGQPLKVTDPTMRLEKVTWHSLQLHAFCFRGRFGDMDAFGRMAVVPLGRRTLMIGVVGNEARKAEVDETLQALLASLKGDVGYHEPVSLAAIAGVLAVGGGLAFTAGIVIVIYVAVTAKRRPLPRAAPPRRGPLP